MSINFANVKAITIPEGSVKSIASGGVTLWKKAVTPQHTTYRLLDYIKFSGTEYVLTDHKPTNNRYYYLNFEIASKVNDRFIFAAGGDSTDAGPMRCTVRTSASYFQRRYGRNSSSNANIGTVCNINTFYQLRFRIVNDFQAYFGIADSNGTVLGTSSASTPQTFTPANMNTFAIMGYGQGTTASNLTAGKVYRYYYRIGDASGELGCNAYPVQRKSDGVCGLYDTVTSTFYPMQGTVITDQAAGNTVTEEWIPGGYPNEAIIPEAQWTEGWDNFYYRTSSKNFWNLLSSHATDGKVANVTLTISVYNPTEDATYTTTATNNITYNATNSEWKNTIFNVYAVYNSNGDTAWIPTFIIRNGGTTDSDTTQLNGNGLRGLYNTYGCSIVGDVKLVLNSVN